MRSIGDGLFVCSIKTTITVLFRLVFSSFTVFDLLLCHMQTRLQQLIEVYKVQIKKKTGWDVSCYGSFMSAR